MKITKVFCDNCKYACNDNEYVIIRIPYVAYDDGKHCEIGKKDCHVCQQCLKSFKVIELNPN